MAQSQGQFWGCSQKGGTLLDKFLFTYVLTKSTPNLLDIFLFTDLWMPCQRKKKVWTLLKLPFGQIPSMLSRKKCWPADFTFLIEKLIYKSYDWPFLLSPSLCTFGKQPLGSVKNHKNWQVGVSIKMWWK